jgi:hypothetical protein
MLFLPDRFVFGEVQQTRAKTPENTGIGVGRFARVFAGRGPRKSPAAGPQSPRKSPASMAFGSSASVSTSTREKGKARASDAG